MSANGQRHNFLVTISQLKQNFLLLGHDMESKCEVYFAPKEKFEKVR